MVCAIDSAWRCLAVTEVPTDACITHQEIPANRKHWVEEVLHAFGMYKVQESSDATNNLKSWKHISIHLWRRCQIETQPHIVEIDAGEVTLQELKELRDKLQLQYISNLDAFEIKKHDQKFLGIHGYGILILY